MNLYNPGTTNTKCIRCHKPIVKEGTLCNDCEEILSPFEWEELRKRLDTFDRTYEFSDSHSVWKRWNREEKELHLLIKEAAEMNRTKTLMLIKRFNEAEKYGTKFSLDKTWSEF